MVYNRGEILVEIENNTLTQSKKNFEYVIIDDGLYYTHQMNALTKRLKYHNGSIDRIFSSERKLVSHCSNILTVHNKYIYYMSLTAFNIFKFQKTSSIH